VVVSPFSSLDREKMTLLVGLEGCVGVGATVLEGGVDGAAGVGFCAGV
jgi:hypothetical protein